MKAIPVFSVFAGLLLTGCGRYKSDAGAVPSVNRETASAESVRLTIDSEKSGAYVSRDHMNVYLVVDANDVIGVTLALPEGRIPLFQISLDTSHAGSITHFSGPGVASYVLPQGAAQPFPAGSEYARVKARRGIISCRNAPLKGRFEYDTKIVISLDQVDYGAGKLYSLAETELTVSAFPP